MNLVFVLFDHLHVFVNPCSFCVSPSHVFTISGSLMSAILLTCLRVCVLEFTVSSVLPSFCCCSRKARMFCSIWLGFGSLVSIG